MQASVPGLFNFRDPTTAGTLGAGPTKRPGVLFRSSALDRLDAQGRAALTRLGITTVVDLREPDESAAAPDAVSAPVRTVNRPIYGVLAPKSTPLRDVYDHIMTERGHAVTGAVQAILGAPGPVLVHCAAGKDRTGIVVAVLLAAAGVPRPAIIADYALSAGQLPAGHKEATRLRLQAEFPNLPELRTALHLHLESPREAIGDVLDVMEAGYGGAAGFLLAHGASARDIESARSFFPTRLCPA
ncbi:MAG: protein tyrosine phosphatase [Pseudarthrobacter sp.]|nr:protein tyrosine phosphatase [Pseudarthrobacter sp.]